MSPVDFRKYQCCMSLSLIYAHVACRISEMALSHVTKILEALSDVNKLNVAYRNGRVALSISGVKGHTLY